MTLLGFLCGYIIFDSFDEVLFDRRDDKIKVYHDTLFSYVLGGNLDYLAAAISEVDSVSIEEDKSRYSGTGYIIRLNLTNGFPLPLTRFGIHCSENKAKELVKTIEAWLRS